MYSFKPENQAELQFETGENVFHPTATSLYLIRAFSKAIKKPGKVLDLGCGCGVVGIVAGKLGLASVPVCASDLSADAVECALANARKHEIEVDVRVRSLIDPWKGYAFDYIVDDVSGVAEEIAAVSEWFRGVPCHSGADGTALVGKVIRESSKYLTSGGKLFFPIISLSNGNKILDIANECFTRVMRIAHEEWPLPSPMIPHTSLLRDLHREGKIRIVEKFGMIILSTDIYVACNGEE